MRFCATVALMFVASCGDTVFACDEDSDCAGSGSSGACEANGYCSFPDDACASGRRYGDRGPAGIAGTCVPVGEEETGDVTGTSVASTSSSSMTSVDPSSSGSTMMVGDTSSETTSLTAEASGETETSSASTTTSGGPMVVEYEAVIAVCTEVGVYDPEHCALEAGLDQFTIDTADLEDYVSNGWVRFDTDAALVDYEITGVELVLRVGSDELDNSDQSGELWLVDAFDMASLTMGDPAGLEMLAADLGVVDVGAEVTFEVPPDVFAPSSSIHFGLFPITSDGLDYRAHTSDTPPRLVVHAR